MKIEREARVVKCEVEIGKTTVYVSCASDGRMLTWTDFSVTREDAHLFPVGALVKVTIEVG